MLTPTFQLVYGFMNGARTFRVMHVALAPANGSRGVLLKAKPTSAGLYVVFDILHMQVLFAIGRSTHCHGLRMLSYLTPSRLGWFDWHLRVTLASCHGA
jgi:hypothetical protein